MLKKAWHKLTNRDVRYITLMGDPTDQPLSRTFWRSAAFKSCTALMATHVGIGLMREDYAQTCAILVGGAAGFIVSKTLSDLNVRTEIEALFPDHKDLCIDKRGPNGLLMAEGVDQSTAKFRSQILERVYLQGGLLDNVIRVLFALGLASDLHSSSIGAYGPASSFGQLYLATLISTKLSAGLRFQNVAKGKWIISKKTHTRQEQADTAGAPDAVPDMA